MSGDRLDLITDVVNLKAVEFGLQQYNITGNKISGVLTYDDVTNDSLGIITEAVLRLLVSSQQDPAQR